MKHTVAGIASLLLASLVAQAEADLKVSSLFTDHMILQRDKPVPVWGWADPNEKVTVEFGGQTKTAISDATGKWLVKLDAMPASEKPGVLSVSVSNPNSKIQNLKCSDILVGDVWLASGQSNMGFGVKGSLNGEQEIAAAHYPTIRLFSVAQCPTLTPTNGVKGAWQPCSPQTVGEFSGVAYFFGRELHKDLKIPIGLLHSSVGGTPAEAWTRLEAMAPIPGLGERAQKEIAQILAQPEDNKRFPGERDAWERKYGVQPPPISEAARNWADPALDTRDWKQVTLPGRWQNLGFKTGGVFWLRKEILIPEELAGKASWVSFNWVSEQYDTAFVNGVEVGHANDKAPGFYNVQRGYPVPGKLMKAGRNVVAFRVVSATENAGVHQWGRGVFPFVGLKNVDDQWLLKVESTFPRLPPEALKSRPKPNDIASRSVSSALYNGMIVPLIPFAIKGAIWYQGESNAGRAPEYRQLLTALIGDWRAQWGQGDFPFHIVQLANYYTDPKEPAESGVAAVREVQLYVSTTVTNCGLAVAIDLGEEGIHPKNKQDVGKRLALVAMEKTYGQKIESSGPRFESMKIEGNSIRIKFSHAEGLNAKGGPLQRFAIADASKKFVWAEAKIDGDTVLVSSPQITTPVAVRYAWGNNPEGCNLYNAVGLPASPFRTDERPISVDSGKPLAIPALAEKTRTPPMYFGDATRLGRPFAKDPSVIRFGGRYLMYYSITAWAKELAPTNAPRGWAIGIAESRDLVNWKKIGEILPEQVCEKNGIVNGRIILLDGKLHLFYNSYGNGAKDALCHATSEDGLHFTRNPTNPIWHPVGDWNNGRAIDVDVVEWGGQLIMYYATRDPKGKIQMLHAIAAPRKSGFNRDDWKSLCEGPVLKPELPWEKTCIEAPSVIKRSDTLYLFYGGGYNNAPQQIGCATSKDGIHFQRLFIDKPLLPNGAPGTWNSSESGHPGMFEDDDGQLYMFYQANNDQGRTWFLSWVKIGWDGDKPCVIESQKVKNP